MLVIQGDDTLKGKKLEGAKAATAFIATKVLDEISAEATRSDPLMCFTISFSVSSDPGTYTKPTKILCSLIAQVVSS
jgi:hypothetical protein